MGQREHCILITPVLPRQHGAGLEQRAFYLVEDLAIRYDITLFIASDPPLTLDEITEASPALMSLIKSCRPIAVRHARGLRRKLALLFPPIVGWRPAWATEWPIPSSVLPPLPESVDLLAVFRMRMHTTAKFVARNTAPRYCLLDLDDLEPTTLKSMARQAFRRGRLRFAAHLMCMSKQQALLERRIVPAYNRVLLANPDDVRELMSREPFVQIDCRPNRVRLQSNGERRPPDGPFTLSFLATLDYFPNIDAALWIAEELAPKLRRQLRARGTDLRIQIAGRGASRRLRKRLGRVQQLEFLGPVDDLRSFYDGSHAAIIPVRCGGGTKIKLLEAISYGCPVVTTPHTLRGTPFLHEQHLLSAEDTRGMVDCCNDVNLDAAAAAQRAAKAYATLASLPNAEDPATI